MRRGLYLRLLAWLRRLAEELKDPEWGAWATFKFGLVYVLMESPIALLGWIAHITEGGPK